jgi:hypothetical protein
MTTLRIILSMPFYLMALLFVHLANWIGGATFIIRPRSQFLPDVVNYTGSMEEDSP